MFVSIMKVGVLPLILTATLVTGAAAADDKQTLQFGGRARSYVVRAPTLDKSASPVALVLVLHGGGGNAANAEQMTGFTEKARKEGFIVVYPEGTGVLRNGLLTWNFTHCCGYAMSNNVDDVGFINALIDQLMTTYPIDGNRIFVTGMSNGGMMTHRIGAELSHRVAAIAPVVATLFGDEKKPAHPVSALIVNGAQDHNVPTAGGQPTGRGSNAWDGKPMLPTEKQAEFWAKANDCKDAASRNENSEALRVTYACPAGRSVKQLIVKDNGHAWPGGSPGSRRGDKPSTAFNATDLIWDFFKAHPKAAR